MEKNAIASNALRQILVLAGMNDNLAFYFYGGLERTIVSKFYFAWDRMLSGN
jgi:hypothetical protein